VAAGDPALWAPPTGVVLLRHQPSERVVELPNGERVNVTVDDSGTVTHVEHDDRLDAIVRPRSTTVTIRRKER
jgi:hypothetical protein